MTPNNQLHLLPNTNQATNLLRTCNGHSPCIRGSVSLRSSSIRC